MWSTHAGLGCAVLMLAGTAASQPSYDPEVHGLPALLSGRGFVKIEAGEFQMGSSKGNADEQPPHRVQITRSFEMSKFEITQAQWDAVMRTAHPPAEKGKAATRQVPPSSNPSHFKGSTHPVEKVSWPDVQEFLRTLNSRDPAHVYRLPTEAEWEYACRAGTTGDYAGNLDEMGWYEGNSGGETHPVGQKKPNAWGLYDMHGNVWEWVQDWYGNDYYENAPPVDPRGPAAGSYRVYRGGSWSRAAEGNRSSSRGFDFPNTGYYNVGFRIVRTPK